MYDYLEKWPFIVAFYFVDWLDEKKTAAFLEFDEQLRSASSICFLLDRKYRCINLGEMDKSDLNFSFIQRSIEMQQQQQHDDERI